MHAQKNIMPAILKVGKPVYKDISYYLDLPWEFHVASWASNGSKGYVITIPGVIEFRGAMASASSLDEAMKTFKKNMTKKIEELMATDKTIPEPMNESQYSGRITYRTTKKQHCTITREATKHNLSLSKMIDMLILKGLQYL